MLAGTDVPFCSAPLQASAVRRKRGSSTGSRHGQSRQRYPQGIAKARTEGRYHGRPEDKKRNAAIINMLNRGMSWNAIIEAASGSGKKLSRATLSKLAPRVKEAA